ncbi:hypothetical protein C0L85_07900 [Clostridium perfringens]|uniref:hypothetical protein n=1 Tax=Clostridium perfringens TaxID=1502 RepID=UPI000D8B73E5|nr:hypothetical protein [Clostridium perfringens]UBK58663.1 hypothetical protein KLF43_02250 [Clostridium perfringens]UBK61195.1 hypothetical protein KLF23_02375 [Clostridium perfringens]SQB23575.1 Uncharacterised protein [Clostridium perfringens]VTQ58489.1 Uncharacterised protein [Clostridium perfringens]HAT4281563.1 hypothetical protein [Clostridium perfringens]
MNILFEIMIIVLTFQDWIACKIPIVSYLDEFICVITVLYIITLLLRKVKFKLSRYEIYALSILFLYIILGLVSNLSSEIVPTPLAILSIVMTVKGYILYFGWRIIFQVYGIKIKLFKNVSKIFTISIYLLTLVGLINIPFKFLKSSGDRFGINTVAIGFSHVTELAFFVVISMIFVLFNNRIYQKELKDYRIIIPSVFLLILTGRSKAIGFVALFLFVFYCSKLLKKIKIRYFILVLPLVVYIVMPRIKSELLNGPRGSLYIASLEIAKDFFPLGSGFGTYGSYISRLYYSPLYYFYNLSSIWGLSPDMPSYITDTYWAMVIGEVGFIGALMIILLLILIFVQFFLIKSDYKLKILSISLILYTVMASIAEPIYSSNKCSILFIVLALFITFIRENSRVKNVGEIDEK